MRRESGREKSPQKLAALGLLDGDRAPWTTT
jgi:hypothetical protein